MTIEDIVNRFNTTPFLFVGSGITRRYLNLPDWKGLLEYFANMVREDEFAYSSYENMAMATECKAGILPKVAELIQKDFDAKWFAEPDIRTLEAQERRWFEKDSHLLRQLENFKLLYCALQGKKAKLPVKLLRRFKQEVTVQNHLSKDDICIAI